MTGAVMSAVDVTSRIDFEERLSGSHLELAEQRELLYGLIQDAPAAIALFNENGDLHLFSTEFERLMGSLFGIDDISGPMFQKILRGRSPNFLMELFDITIKEKRRVEVNEMEITPERDEESVFCNLVGVPIIGPSHGTTNC